MKVLGATSTSRQSEVEELVAQSGSVYVCNFVKYFDLYTF